MVIWINFDDLCNALESSDDCYVNLNSGKVIQLPPESQDPDGFFELDRDEIAENPKIFQLIPPFPSNVGFSIREEFAKQLPEDEPLKLQLLEALQKSRPFRRFKDVLDRNTELRAQWFQFKESEMDYWAPWWLRKNGIDAEIQKDRRSLPRE